MLPAKLLAFFLALLGHLALWVAVHNRLHAVGWPRRLVKASKNTALLIMAGPLAVILGWAMSVTPPDAYQVWHSSQAVPGGSNHVYYRNEEVDRILEEYRVEFDAERRKRLYDRFQEILHEDQPYTFLFMQKAITAWDRRFHGVRWYPSGGTDLHEWWVPVEQQKYTQ